MTTVYVLKSEKSGRHYIGCTDFVLKRLRQHNNNEVPATKNKGPWRIIYTEKYEIRKTALQRERKLKSYKCGNGLKQLIGV
jgi:putative endonuclease